MFITSMKLCGLEDHVDAMLIYSTVITNRQKAPAVVVASFYTFLSLSNQNCRQLMYEGYSKQSCRQVFVWE